MNVCADSHGTCQKRLCKDGYGEPLWRILLFSQIVPKPNRPLSNRAPKPVVPVVPYLVSGQRNMQHGQHMKHFVHQWCKRERERESVCVCVCAFVHGAYRGGGDFAPSQIRGGKFRCGKFRGAPWSQSLTPRQSPQCVLLVCEKFAENPEFCVGISQSI